ncbi:MAG: site-specific integrase [Actinobacteria bacterium]|nr:site-specific integrase [Actinomycetota bacterium]
MTPIGRCRGLLAEVEAVEVDFAGPESVSLAGWLDEWWDAKRRTLSPTTASAWRSSVELYLKPEPGELDLADIRAHHLEALYRRLVDGGLSAARVQKVHTVASVALKAAVRREYITVSPATTARAPAIDRVEPRAPTPDEVASILKTASDDLDFHAFLIVATNTGARRGEVCALRWCDVDLERRVVTISRSVAKGAGGGATVRQTKTGVVGQAAVSDQVVAVLKATLVRRTDAAAAAGVELCPAAYIWSQDIRGTRPVYPDTMTARFGRVRDDLGLGHVQLRHLRHYAATQLLSAGVDVRTVAGRLRHARPAMTLDRYAAWVPARDREAADLLDNLGR